MGEGGNAQLLHKGPPVDGGSPVAVHGGPFRTTHTTARQRYDATTRYRRWIRNPRTDCTNVQTLHSASWTRNGTNRIKPSKTR